jgi:peptide/nickel transport system permease protein
VTPGYLLASLARCLLTIWAASTFLFFLPVLTIGRDPSRARFYFLRLGPEDSLWQQYLTFLGHVARLDFGVARTMAPSRVNDLIALLLPWSIGLLGTATLIAVALGTLLGALMAWPGAPRRLRALGLPLVALSAVPAYLLGLILVDLFAFRLRLFPIGGAAPTGVVAAPAPGHLLAMLHHAALPALAIVLTAIGFWALAARGMMVTALGEDYITLAEAKGLRPRRILLGYALRNVLLPQVTALGLALGQVVSGALLVEIIFGYPGVGTLLYRAVIGFDYNMIHGVVLIIIVAVSLAGLALDLLLPLIDPRLRPARSQR